LKKISLIATGIIILLFVSACGFAPPFKSDEQNFHMNPEPRDGERSEGSMGMGMMHGHDLPLDSSAGENELNVPPMLASDLETEDEVHYTIDAQAGKTEIFDNVETETLGYNGSFLGPVLKLKKGQTAHFTLKNSLDEETTFHWHGLIIDGEADGGPHTVLAPGEEKEITFDVVQDKATLWFHPHPEGETAKQVYDGLAGLMYIDDNGTDNYEYGKNDFPLIIQDKTFTEDKQLDYKAVRDPDGTMGETLLINGTVNPKLTVGKEKVRLRLLNGSNMRNYTFKLSNGEAFEQIATDGGLLNDPIEREKIELTPSERAEIVVDFSEIDDLDDLALIREDHEANEETVVLPFDVDENQAVTENKVEKSTNPVEITDEELEKPVTKEINLSGMGHHVAINGKKFDKDRIDLEQKQGETEVWEVKNERDMMGGMIHPFHIHGTQFKVISVNGEEPPAHLQGYKDTISIEPGDTAKLAVKFEEKGIYMYHCHILEHEDNGMMGQIEVK